jgi:transposase-like protein
MKNPAYEQIQARKVKARLRMLQHAQRISGNVSQTCRFFGVSRALYYIWKQRYEKHGVAGLRDLPRRPHKIRFRIPPEIVSLILRIREERRYGAVRVSLYLQRHYHAYVSPTTILKISFIVITLAPFRKRNIVPDQNHRTHLSRCRAALSSSM